MSNLPTVCLLVPRSAAFCSVRDCCSWDQPKYSLGFMLDYSIYLFIYFVREFFVSETAHLSRAWLLEIQSLSGTCSAACDRARELQDVMAEGLPGPAQYPARHTSQAPVAAAAAMAKQSWESYVVPQSSCTGSHILKCYNTFFLEGGRGGGSFGMANALK